MIGEMGPRIWGRKCEFGEIGEMGLGGLELGGIIACEDGVKCERHWCHSSGELHYFERGSGLQLDDFYQLNREYILHFSTISFFIAILAADCQTIVKLGKC